MRRLVPALALTLLACHGQPPPSEPVPEAELQSADPQLDAPPPSEPPPSEPPPSEPPPSEPPPKDSGEGTLTALSGGTRELCDPASVSDCSGKANHPGVDATLASKPTGVVTIAAVVVETDTRCTHSMPPSCASSLALRDRSGGPGERLALPPSFACSDNAQRSCCSLATDGTRYAVTGTVDVGRQTMQVDSVCRIP